MGAKEAGGAGDGEEAKESGEEEIEEPAADGAEDTEEADESDEGEIEVTEAGADLQKICAKIVPRRLLHVGQNVQNTKTAENPETKTDKDRQVLDCCPYCSGQTEMEPCSFEAQMRTGTGPEAL